MRKIILTNNGHKSGKTMIKKFILYIVLGIIYIFIYPFKIKKDKITFISYKTDRLEGNFKLISNNLIRDNQYEMVYLFMKYKNNLWGNFKYFINCIKQVYHVNTSKVVVLDYNNYVVSNFKKKDVKVIQVWHATGAIKQFGNDINREYKIRNYDYVLATSKIWKKPYSSAFNVTEEQVVPLGIPKTDNLFSEARMEKYKKYVLNKYPQIKGKKVVLFAPTFRGDPISDIKYQEVDLKYIADQLGDEYILIYKLHPWFGDKNVGERSDLINANSENINRLFAVTDYLITDYSAIIFDYAILNKPALFLVPDLEEYKKERGMYIDYENEMPGPICFNENEVVNAIKSDDFDLEKIQKFRTRYFKYTDGQSTKRVCEFVEDLIKNK